MAYSDWNIVRKRYTFSDAGGTILPQPEISGAPVPGDNARKYFYYRQGTTGNTNLEFTQTKAHIADPSYVDLPHNTAISVRAKLKVNNFVTDLQSVFAGSPLVYSVGLNVYSKQITSVSDTNGFGGGYNLCLVREKIEHVNVNPDIYTTNLVIRAASGTQNAAYGYDGSTDVTVCTGTYLTDTWYDVRFDVIPTTLTDKNLIAYTSDDDGATWTQVGSYSVNIGQGARWSSDIGAYIGYESGFFCSWGNYGINNTNNAETYIKDFKLNIDPINFNP